MSNYRYNSYTDTFEKLTEESATISISNQPTNPIHIYPVMYVADECIEKIADAVVRKLKEREEHE